jgi:uncharacterized protein (UPF0147 family)
MEKDRHSDLIMATALAKTLAEVVERLDEQICDDSTLRELRRIADRAEEELEQAA